jgi:hypothetical protein
MSLTTKEHLSLVLQITKKLLSFKADKTEVATKIDRSEVEEEDAIQIVADMGLVSPIAAEDGAIYTDENGAVYTL